MEKQIVEITLNGKKYQVEKCGKNVIIDGKDVDSFLDYLARNDRLALIQVAELGKYLTGIVDRSTINKQKYLNELHQKLSN